MTSEAIPLIARRSQPETRSRLLQGESGLVARAQAGDREAFDRLMRDHERRVWGLARNLLRSREEVADIAQQAFLRLYRHLHRLDPDRSPWPYLCRIVVNLCRDAERQRARTRTEPLETIEREPRSRERTPGQQALAAERGRLLRRSLDRLPARERQAIVLRDLEGLATEEVARLLGSSPTTVRSQISRARLRLRQMLDASEVRDEL